MSSPVRSRKKKASKSSNLDNREEEIREAYEDLARSSSYEVDALRTRNVTNERHITRLNTEIDYLRQKNDDLQRQLDKAAIKTGSLERDKEVVIRTADMELFDAKTELEQTKREQEILDTEIAHMKAERAAILSEMDDSKIKMNDKIAQLSELFTKAQQDKKKLGNRITKLINNERELVLEIDRLKHRSTPVKNGKKTAKQIESFIKNLEDERNYWKNEVAALNKFLNIGKQLSSPTTTRSRSRSLSPSRKSKGIVGVQDALRTAEEERDHYKRECELLKSIRRTASPKRSNKQHIADSNSLELDKMKKERDELQILLDKFERHMTEIQSNVKVLTSDRDKFADLYKETKRELDRLRKDVVRSTKTAKSSIAVQSVLNRVENERDKALLELRRVATDRDSLRERLKIATESQLTDRAHLEQKVDELETALRSSELDREDAINRWKSMNEALDCVESKVRIEGEASATHKATASQMRMVAEKAERASNDARRQLSKIEGDLIAEREKNIQLENELIAYKRQDDDQQHRSDSLQADLHRLRNEVDSLAKEKERLNNELEDKDRSMMESRKMITEFESQLNRYKDDVRGIERDRDLLRRQRNEIGDELAAVKRAKEESLRENRLLLDELSNARKTGNDMKSQLDVSLAEQDDLRDQIQGYVAEVKRAEELLNMKEKQRSELLEQFKSINANAERYETATHELQSQSSTLRLELTTRDTELRNLRERNDEYEREILDLKRTESSYQAQISHLTNTISQLEDCIRRGETDKRLLANDLTNVKDLVGRSELSKEQLYNQLLSSQEQIHALNRTLEEYKTANDQLHRRSKDPYKSLALKEAESEITLLKDKLLMNESKLNSQTQDLNNLHKTNIKLQSEYDVLQRQITNERFERERLSQELRRYRYQPQNDSLSRY